MVVPCAAALYSYTGAKVHLHFLWKVSLEAEDVRMTKNMSLRDKLREEFPLYHTRAMRKDFIQTFGYVTHTKSAFLREMYKQLTGDCSASANFVESEIDDQIKLMIDCEDPDLIRDLRANNKSEEKYQVFLEKCQQYIDSQVQTAVDDRRHDTVDSDNSVITHLATPMSVSDLHSSVRESCPENTPIPSLQWLRLQ